MKSERTNVDFPLWRKKVDASLFRHGGTTIPKWVCRIWNLDKAFPGLKGKSDRSSQIQILFNKTAFSGQITCTWPKKRADKAYRLWFGEDLNSELKEVFLMSFMRDLESRLSRVSAPEYEEEIPFWEFLDIEFSELDRKVLMTAHYTQKPIFPHLFQRLTYSPMLKRIDDELDAKSENKRIYKQDWRPRAEFETEIGAENVIYNLIDTKNRLFYVGEAKNLIRRFRAGHPSILDWDFYRYDVLPSSLEEFRVALERMVIRMFASALPNKADIQTIGISDFKLMNDKIDR